MNQSRRLAAHMAPRVARLSSRAQRKGDLAAEREQTQVCLYASNIAACIGMNPYRKPHKALEEIWTKQFPQSYQAAVARTERKLNIKLQSEQEAIAAAAAKHKVDNLIQRTLEQSAATTSSADAVATDSSAQVAITDAVSKRATESAKKALKRADRDFAAPVKAQMQKVLAAKLPLDKKAAAVEEALQSGGPLTPAAEAAGKGISETLSTAKSETVLIQQHVQREIYTGHGIRSEAPAIQMYASRFNRLVREDTRFRVKPLAALACKRQVLIGGRVDGIASCEGEEILVEVKNRMKRLFSEAPLYEQVQTQALLQILGLQRGELVQCLRGSGQGALEMQVLPFTKDSVMWTEQLEPKILDFCVLFDSFLDNDDMMQSLLACKGDDEAKAALVSGWS